MPADGNDITTTAGDEPYTIAEAAADIRGGRATSVSLTERCLSEIERRNGSLNAFITTLAEEARTRARIADRELSGGRDRGPLHGIPVSLKDLFDMQGVPTTAASLVRVGHVASADATVVRRLRDAGAVLVGKTNLHEFAFGTTNEDSAFGPARHPLDESRSPGGSSGGSAASILAGMSFASIGTDTGGSIRIPAAACGLVGLKPAIGELPTDGVTPLSTTLDHVGPLCRSVDDARLLFQVMRGRDSGADVPSAPHHEPPAVTRSVSGLRLGVLRGYFTALIDSDIARCFEESCRRLQQAGAVLDDVELPHAADIATVYLHIVLAEASAYHASTLESRPEAYTPNVRIRLEMGRYVLAEDYVRAMRGRDVLHGEVEDLLTGRDALLLPSLPIPAPKLGVPLVRIGAGEEPVRNVMLRLTQLFNITGHPALTLRSGTTPGGLPAGLQLAGRRTLDLLDTAGRVEAQLGPGMSG